MKVEIYQPITITITVEKHSEARAITMACAMASDKHLNLTQEQRDFLKDLRRAFEAQGL